MRRKLAAGLLAVVAVAAGCSGVDDDPVSPLQRDEPVATVTVTQPEPKETVSDKEVARLALRMAWDKMSRDDRSDVCLVWVGLPDSRSMLVDQFMEGAGDTGAALGRGAVYEFFEEECN